MHQGLAITFDSALQLCIGKHKQISYLWSH